MRPDGSLSIADVEGPWVEQKFESGLIDRCRSGWNTPVAKLPNELLATYLRQKIALRLVVPEARRRIAENFVDGTELYEEELAEAIKSATGAMAKPTYEIDGSRFATLEQFYEEISAVLIPGADWGRNLDAFNDILRGGFGTPEGGFVLRWTNSRLSRQRLGYAETVRQLERRLQRCHPSNRSHVARDLEAARRGEGATVFDWLVEIISVHQVGGDEAEDGVELVLA